MTHHTLTRFRHTATALVAAIGVAAAPAVVVTSLANPPAAVAKKKKKSCEGGDAGTFFRHGKYERMPSRNEDGSRDYYRRKCNNGKWGAWVQTGTTYPGTSDGSEGGPTV
jgi:hypothetical protein